MAVAPLTLVVGDEELLVSRAVRRVVSAVSGDDPAAEVVELSARELDVGGLAELLSPSLFGDRRVVVVRDGQDLGKDAAAPLTGYAIDPADGVHLVVVHSGGGRNKAVLQALRDASAVVEVPKIRWPEERERFVVDEVRAAGGSITPDAAAGVVASVGTDLRELASACAQLVADSGGQVDADVVARYHRGRAEATGFVVADRAVEGDASGAVELLRWALGTGMSPVLVTSSLAANLRLVAGVAGAGRGSPQAVASALGVPVWKVKKAQAWARHWHPDALAEAVTAVAEADAAVKGGGADPAYAAERVVLQVAAAQGRR